MEPLDNVVFVAFLVCDVPFVVVVVYENDPTFAVPCRALFVAGADSAYGAENNNMSPYMGTDRISLAPFYVVVTLVV